MNTNTSEQKRNSIITLAKVRGYKVMTPKQDEDILLLVTQTDLSPREIVDEVFSAPQGKMKRRVKSAKKHLRKALVNLSDKLKEDEK